MKEITKNGQTVQCYGEYREDNNYFCVFEDEEFDGVFTEGADSWEQVVNVLTQYALDNDTVLVELQAV